MLRFIFPKKRKIRETSLELEEAMVVRSFSSSQEQEDNIPNIALRSSITRAATYACLGIFLATLLITANITIRSGSYRAQAQNNISRALSIPAIRGTIADRFGKLLLENTPGFRVFLNPTELPADQDARARIIESLSEKIGMSVRDIVQLMNAAGEENGAVFLTRDISTEKAINLRSSNLPGVEVVDEVSRKYEGGQALSHVIGYIGAVREEDKRKNPTLRNADVVGRGGLEAFYDSELRGENGVRVFEKSIDRKTFMETGVKPPQSGYSLETTIDADFQKYVFDRFSEGLASLGRKRGAAVILDPNTGEILSLVSFPSFDSNWFMQPQLYREKIQTTLLDPNKPLFNRVISGTYNPGSTIKPLVALAALEERIIDPRKTFDDPGYLLVPNPYNPETPSIFVDWKAHGIVDMRRALAVSANVYFYIIGGGTDYQKGLGVERLKNYYAKFNLGSPTRIDLPGEVAGQLPKWNDPGRKSPWRLGDTYNISIGQGEFQITPIELASYVASIANGGTIYQPHIVKKIKTADNKVMREVLPQVLSENLADAANIAVVTAGMRDVVRQPYGTGNLLSSLPFSVAGKSGTAQFGDKRTINALFVAFAPAEKPKIALAMLVEDAREGALNVVPIVKDVLMWYYLNRGL